MNVEELASLWHFPIESVTKAPLLQKASGRKAEPPASLPLEEVAPMKEPPLDPLFQEAMGGKPQAPARIESVFADESIFEDERAELSAAKKEEDDVFVSEEEYRAAKSSGRKAGPPPNLPFG